MNARLFEELASFVLVVEEGTLGGAARRMGVPTSTISRRVERLEEHLGQALLRRTARSVAPSEAGRALAQRSAPALREVLDAMDALGDADEHPRGTLRVSAPPDLGGSACLAGVLAGFSLACPEVVLELSLDTRYVDLFEEGYDLALRIHGGQLPASDHLVAARLGQLRGGLYASPGYLAERGAPCGPAELFEHPLVGHAGAAFREGWSLEGPAGPLVLPVAPAILLDDFAPIGELLAAGAGVGLLPSFVAAPHLEAGRLVPLLEDWRLPSSTLSLVWLRSRHLAPRVRAFVDHLREGLSEVPWLSR